MTRACRMLIVCDITSLDGHFEGPGDNVMTLPVDEGFNEHTALLRTADAVLMGRRFFDQAKVYSARRTADAAAGAKVVLTV